MADLQSLPTELFTLTVEHLVQIIGIQKAVLLRTVSRRFDASIQYAICTSQVVDVNDPATPSILYRMDPGLRGKLFVAKSHSAEAASKRYLSVVAKVNKSLDELSGETEQETLRSRHEAVAGAVLLKSAEVSAKVEASNLLSGAAIIGDLSILESVTGLVDADVNGSTPYFYSPVVHAAARGHLHVVRWLLERGARPNVESTSWFHYSGLSCQADWNSKDESVWSSSLLAEPPSALRAAVLNNRRDIAHLLLHPHYRLPTNSLEYLRTILAGAKAGCLDLILLLFSIIGRTLSDFDGLGNEMLWEAARYGRKEVVRWLLDNDVDVNVFPFRIRHTTHSALQIAASLGNESMICFLVGRGAHVNLNGLNKRGGLPIESAANCGQEGAVSLLIDLGADPVKALCSAAGGGQPRLMRQLLKRLPDLPHRRWGDVGKEAFIKAIRARNLTAMTILVNAGVSINDGWDFDHDGYQMDLPLDLAKQDGLGWVADHLISLGAHDTGGKTEGEGCKVDVRDVRVSQRTWEWVGRF